MMGVMMRKLLEIDGIWTEVSEANLYGYGIGKLISCDKHLLYQAILLVLFEGYFSRFIVRM